MTCWVNAAPDHSADVLHIGNKAADGYSYVGAQHLMSGSGLRKGGITAAYPRLHDGPCVSALAV